MLQELTLELKYSILLGRTKKRAIERTEAKPATIRKPRITKTQRKNPQIVEETRKKRAGILAVTAHQVIGK